MLRHAFSNPKLAALCRRLKIPRGYAVGILESLWFFTATQAPRGDIGRWSDEEITAAIDVPLDPAALVSALVSTRWLDACAVHRLVVHDWSHHCDQTVRRCPQVRAEGFVSVVVPTQTSESLVNDERRTSEALAADFHGFKVQRQSLDSLSLSPVPAPEPEPVPAPEPEPEPVPEPAAEVAALPPAAPSLFAEPRDERPQKARTPRPKRAPSDPATKPAKPGARAAAIFAEEYKAQLQINPAITPRDARELGGILESLGEPRLRNALKCYFNVGKIQDEWIRKQGYSVREFIRQLTRFDHRAQKRASYGSPMIEKSHAEIAAEEAAYARTLWKTEEEMLAFLGGVEIDRDGRVIREFN